MGDLISVVFVKYKIGSLQHTPIRVSPSAIRLQITDSLATCVLFSEGEALLSILEKKIYPPPNRERRPTALDSPFSIIRALSKMSHWFGRVQVKMRGVLKALNLATDVGRDVFPERKYRPAPASAPAPLMSLNFPMKTENLADKTYATRAPRLAAQAGEVHRQLSSNPNEDFRNMYFAPGPHMWPVKVPTNRMIVDLITFQEGDK